MSRGLKGLESKVLDRGQCAACGHAFSMSLFALLEGRAVKLHDCDLSEGRCFSFCPRTEVDLDALHRSVFGKGYEDIETGPLCEW